MHAVVARSMFRSQHVKSTPLSGHFWTFNRATLHYNTARRKLLQVQVQLQQQLQLQLPQHCTTTTTTTALQRQLHLQAQLHYNYSHNYNYATNTATSAATTTTARWMGSLPVRQCLQRCAVFGRPKVVLFLSLQLALWGLTCARDCRVLVCRAL